MPKLSVIVPVYNTEKYLRECIDSILTQTFTDFELILVNDGSTDGSGAICDEYADKDPRVKVIHQENGGVTRARKTGAIHSAGDYVTYVDSDDWIDPDCYHSMMTQIEKYRADIGIFAMSLEKKQPDVICNRVKLGFLSKEMLRNSVYPYMLFDYRENCSGLIASLCNKIIRKELLLNAIAAIPDSLDYGEDAISAYLCMLNASSAYICNQAFYHYRDNPISISHADTTVMKKRILALDREMRDLFSGYDMDLSSQIDGHITRHTVELIRSDLIYRIEKPISERCRMARNFSKQPQINNALRKAWPEIRDKKEKTKVLLIRCGMFRLLSVLFKKV